MRSTPVRLLPLLLLLLACVSAAGRRRQQDEPVTQVRVQNSRFVGYTIYVLNGRTPQRLGRVEATSEATFIIPRDLLFGPTPLQFRAVPLASSERPTSEVLQVSPGETVVLLLQP